MPNESTENSAASRIALVTGANKGIGFELVRQLAEAGVRVVLGARDPRKGDVAARSLKDEGLWVETIMIDLRDPPMLQQAAAEFADRFGRLDILVNNAGIAHHDDGPPETSSPDAVREIFETNVIGTLAVVQAFLPLLRKSPAARIVNVSSELGSLTLNGDPEWAFAAHKLFGYNASKAAINMLTVQLAAQLEPLGILVNSADPGFTATDLNGHMGLQSVAHGAAVPLRLALCDGDGPTGGFFGARGAVAW